MAYLLAGGLCACAAEPATGAEDTASASLTADADEPTSDGQAATPEPEVAGPDEDVAEEGSEPEGPAPQVCPPFATFCPHLDEVGACSGDGTFWDSVALCPAGEHCDPASGSCAPVICSPGEPLCAGASTLQPCNDHGTGPNENLTEICEDEAWCFPWEGCLDVGCQPGTWSCQPGGAAAACSAQGWAPVEAKCYGGTCLTCAGPTTFTTCPVDLEEGAAPLPADLQACPPGTECVDGAGCLPEPCEPFSQECLAGDLLASCSIGGWSIQPCPETDACVETGAGAMCIFDCASDVTCLLDACDPLPPLGEGPGVPIFANPTDSNLLTVSFGVGLKDDLKLAFVNLAPIINPKTGEFIFGLDAFEVDPATGIEMGNVAIREDGVLVDATCIPLNTTTYATVDVAFVLDVTGSMSGTINKVKSSTVDLATYWSGQGLDVLFGVIPFDDNAPPGGSGYQNLIDDLDTFVGFVGTLNASGGGDGPENPLDAVMFAWDRFTWRSGAQRVLLVMTDAPMHTPGDGSGFTAHSLKDVLGAVHGEAIVHTMAPDGSGGGFVGNHPSAHVLSCVTGGTAEALQSFVAGDVQESLFATAVSQSHHCVFHTDEPFEPHLVEVEVRYEHEGQLLVGSTSKPGALYVEPEEDEDAEPDAAEPGPDPDASP